MSCSAKTSHVLLRMHAVCMQGTEVLDKEDNVLELEGETVVVGDLHGQFFDLLTLLKTYGEVRGCCCCCCVGVRGLRCPDTVVYQVQKPRALLLIPGDRS